MGAPPHGESAAMETALRAHATIERPVADGESRHSSGDAPTASVNAQPDPTGLRLRTALAQLSIQPGSPPSTQQSPVLRTPIEASSPPVHLAEGASSPLDDPPLESIHARHSLSAKPRSLSGARDPLMTTRGSAIHRTITKETPGPTDRRPSSSASTNTKYLRVAACLDCCCSGGQRTHGGTTSQFCFGLFAALATNIGVILQVIFAVVIPLLICIAILGVMLTSRLNTVHATHTIRQNMQLIGTLQAFKHELGREMTMLAAFAVQAANSSDFSSLSTYSSLHTQASSTDAALIELQNYISDHASTLDGYGYEYSDLHPTAYFDSLQLQDTLAWADWQRQSRINLLQLRNATQLGQLSRVAIPPTLEETIQHALAASPLFSYSSTLAPSALSSLTFIQSAGEDAPTMQAQLSALIQGHAALQGVMLSTLHALLRTSASIAQEDSPSVQALGALYESETWMNVANINDAAMLGLLAASPRTPSPLPPLLLSSLRASTGASISMQRGWDALDSGTSREDWTNSTDAPETERLEQWRRAQEQALVECSDAPLRSTSYSTATLSTFLSDALLPPATISSFCSTSLYSPLLDLTQERYSFSLRALHAFLFLLVLTACFALISLGLLTRHIHLLQKKIASSGAPLTGGGGGTAGGGANQTEGMAAVELTRQGTGTFRDTDDMGRPARGGLALNFMRATSFRVLDSAASFHGNNNGMNSHHGYGNGSFRNAESFSTANTGAGGLHSGGSFPRHTQPRDLYPSGSPMRPRAESVGGMGAQPRHFSGKGSYAKALALTGGVGLAHVSQIALPRRQTVDLPSPPLQPPSYLHHPADGHSVSSLGGDRPPPSPHYPPSRPPPPSTSSPARGSLNAGVMGTGSAVGGARASLGGGAGTGSPRTSGVMAVDRSSPRTIGLGSPSPRASQQLAMRSPSSNRSSLRSQQVGAILQQTEVDATQQQQPQDPSNGDGDALSLGESIVGNGIMLNSSLPPPLGDSDSPFVGEDDMHPMPYWHGLPPTSLAIDEHSDTMYAPPPLGLSGAQSGSSSDPASSDSDESDRDAIGVMGGRGRMRLASEPEMSTLHEENPGDIPSAFVSAAVTPHSAGSRTPMDPSQVGSPQMGMRSLIVRKTGLNANASGGVLTKPSSRRGSRLDQMHSGLVGEQHALLGSGEMTGSVLTHSATGSATPSDTPSRHSPEPRLALGSRKGFISPSDPSTGTLALPPPRRSFISTHVEQPATNSSAAPSRKASSSSIDVTAGQPIVIAKRDSTEQHPTATNSSAAPSRKVSVSSAADGGAHPSILIARISPAPGMDMTPSSSPLIVPPKSRTPELPSGSALDLPSSTRRTGSIESSSAISAMKSSLQRTGSTSDTHASTTPPGAKTTALHSRIPSQEEELAKQLQAQTPQVITPSGSRRVSVLVNRSPLTAQRPVA